MDIGLRRGRDGHVRAAGHHDRRHEGTGRLRPGPPERRETALHILNNFDIPLGFIRDNDDPANDDHTLWLSIANLAQLRYIVRTHGNPVPQLIEVGHVDFSAPGPRETALPHNAFTPLAV